MSMTVLWSVIDKCLWLFPSMFTLWQNTLIHDDCNGWNSGQYLLICITNCKPLIKDNDKLIRTFIDYVNILDIYTICVGPIYQNIRILLLWPVQVSNPRKINILKPFGYSSIYVPKVWRPTTFGIQATLYNLNKNSYRWPTSIGVNLLKLTSQLMQFYCSYWQILCSPLLTNLHAVLFYSKWCFIGLIVNWKYSLWQFKTMTIYRNTDVIWSEWKH